MNPVQRINLRNGVELKNLFTRRKFRTLRYAKQEGVNLYVKLVLLLKMLTVNEKSHFLFSICFVVVYGIRVHFSWDSSFCQ